ncbi:MULTISPECIES: hypothetical protein [Bacillus]|uniref:hypothetical protein n=1 Tax=Bacillus TaxID=1386 RepID=UPI00203F9CE5|nr:hypothetical protein [Bacillus safensis]MCM3140374.1 hypothetical protein [Bacillus safensis]
MLNSLNNMLLGDAMSDLVSSGKSFLKWLQIGGIVSSGIAFCFGGYLLILGGAKGRQTCVPWFLGGAVGLVVVMGALKLAQAVDANIKF